MKAMSKYLYLFTILLITLAACSNSDEPIIDENLLGVVWRVDTLQTLEEEIVPGPDTLMTIQFTKNLEVSGKVICNTYSGIYEISKEVSLSAEVFTWTEIACGGERLWVLHGFFINALENITAYEVDEDRLILYDSDRHYVVKLNQE